MARSPWRRNDFIYFKNEIKKKKSSSPTPPTPPTGQGDIFALVATGNLDGDVGVKRNFFIGYQGFNNYPNTIVNNRFGYVHAGQTNINVILWVDNYGASGIESLLWKYTTFGSARLLCAPTSGSDLYLVSYFGNETFTPQISTITMTGSGIHSSKTYQCSCFPHQFAVNLDSELSNCPSYGSGQCHVMLVGMSYGAANLDDNSLLSLANCVMSYYAGQQTFNNLIRV